MSEVVLDGANRFALPKLREAISTRGRKIDAVSAAVTMSPVMSTCVPYTLNLLMKDVYSRCDSVRAVVDTARDVVKYLKSRDKGRAMLRERENTHR